MALTFGTLLSSQGADAHRRGPFRPFRGNPIYATWSVTLGQPTGSAQLPTWSPHTEDSAARRAWGIIRPDPLGPSGSLAGSVRASVAPSV